MKRAIIATAEIGGAALGELKEWLAISTTAEDGALLALLKTSLEACEAFTNIMPLAATCEEVIPAAREWQTLATSPVQAITGAEGIPAEGSRFALAPDAFEVDLDADGSGLIRIVRQGAAGRIAVRFAAGLVPGWGSLPEALKHGIIRYAGHLYRERGNGEAGSPPAAILALWKPWRRARIG